MILAKTLYFADGETRKVEQQWAAECEKRGTTISSSSWDFANGTASSPAVSGTKATCLLTPTSCGMLTNTVALANGETLVATRAIAMNGAPARDYV